MDWGPDIAVALGILLVFTPHFVGHLHLGDPTYRYEAVEVEPTSDGFEWRGDYPGGGLDDDVACVGPLQRVCPLEQLLLTNNVTTRYAITGEPSGYSYIYVPENGFYRATSERRGGDTRLLLEAVSSEKVFRRTATQMKYVERPIRKAIKSESGTTRRSLLDENKLVRDGGAYYVVTEHLVSHSTQAERRGKQIEALSSVLGPAVGIVLILWGQPKLVRGY